MEPTYNDVISVVDWAREVARRFVILNGYATCGHLDHGDEPIANISDFVQWTFQHWHCRDLDTALDSFFRSRT